LEKVYCVPRPRLTLLKEEEICHQSDAHNYEGNDQVQCERASSLVIATGCRRRCRCRIYVRVPLVGSVRSVSPRDETAPGPQL